MFGLAKALKQDDFDPQLVKKQLAVSKDISLLFKTMKRRL
jgi:choline/glycine/proline betaine transport protein